jgi:hypothetical protein
VAWSGEWVDMPAGRLHAVSGTGCRRRLKTDPLATVES